MTAPGRFELARLAELPTMLDGPNGRGCAAALGRAQDVEQAALTDAVLMRYPPRCPADALDILGADSAIERFDGEPDGTAIPAVGYHGRLAARWPTWAKAGSAQAIIDSLHAYGITDVAVYQDYEAVYWVGNWYSRFGVRIGPDFGSYTWAGPTIDGTLIIDETVIETTATLDQIKAVKRQILKWKAAHAYSVEVTVDYSSGFSTRWIIGRLIEVDFIIDSSTIGGYEV